MLQAHVSVKYYLMTCPDSAQLALFSSVYIFSRLLKATNYHGQKWHKNENFLKTYVGRFHFYLRESLQIKQQWRIFDLSISPFEQLKKFNVFEYCKRVLKKEKNSSGKLIAYIFHFAKFLFNYFNHSNGKRILIIKKIIFIEEDKQNVNSKNIEVCQWWKIYRIITSKLVMWGQWLWFVIYYQ